MSALSAPVIMVHGAFCGGWAFDAFRRPFEAAGHQVLTPDLRGHGEADRPESVVGLSMVDYARDIAVLCAAQASPPVLVGHSLGGLVAAMASRRAKVRALILLAPSAPWGVAGGSMEEAASAFGLHMLGPFWAQAIAPDHATMLRYSLDRMPQGGRRAILERMRSESGRALWETLNWWLDPMMTTSLALGGGGQAPTLVVAGGRDVVHPAATVRSTAERMGAGYLLMPGMSHWLLGEPGWDEIAAEALAWLAAAAPTQDAA